MWRTRSSLSLDGCFSAMSRLKLSTAMISPSQKVSHFHIAITNVRFATHPSATHYLRHNLRTVFCTPNPYYPAYLWYN